MVTERNHNISSLTSNCEYRYQQPVGLLLTSPQHTDLTWKMCKITWLMYKTMWQM